MSETSIRPPGLSTRAISRNTFVFSGERLITQFEITQSTELLSTGRSSMRPLRTSTLVSLPARMFSFALAIISSVMSTPMTRPFGTDLLRGEEQVDSRPGAEIEHHLAGWRVRRARPGCRTRTS